MDEIDDQNITFGPQKKKGKEGRKQMERVTVPGVEPRRGAAAVTPVAAEAVAAAADASSAETAPQTQRARGRRGKAAAASRGERESERESKAGKAAASDPVDEPDQSASGAAKRAKVAGDARKRRVGVLGGGQLGRMLIEAAHPLGKGLPCKVT